MDKPYSNIKCVNKAKILGRFMTTDNNLIGAINDRLLKANTACNMLKNKINTDSQP